MRILPTSQQQSLVAYAPSHPLNFVDVSLESPDVQFEALVGMLEADDAARPAPFTSTPPFGEPTPEDEYIPEDVQESAYLIAPDMQAAADAELLSVVSDAFPADYPANLYWNDDQYFGLAVPPGVPNWGQPIESGHSQIIRNNPAAELGWDAWSGRAVLGRVPRHENSFPGYNASQSRGHMVRPIKLYEPYYLRTQQMRDLLLSEIQRRGIHNVVVADIPAVPYTEQVQVIDPSVLAPQMHIGEEGVLP